MSADLISKKTRLEFREYFVGTTQRGGYGGNVCEVRAREAICLSFKRQFQEDSPHVRVYAKLTLDDATLLALYALRKTLDLVKEAQA